MRYALLTGLLLIGLAHGADTAAVESATPAAESPPPPTVVVNEIPDAIIGGPANAALTLPPMDEADQERLREGITAYEEKRYEHARKQFRALYDAQEHPVLRDWSGLYLGYMMIEGLGGARSVPQGLELLEASSANGLGQATYLLAIRSFRGQARPDPERGLELLQRASQQGFGLASFMMAEMIKEGIFSSENFLDTTRLYQSAISGMAPPVGPVRKDILHAWGVLLSEGQAGPSDGDGAVQLLTTSHELGHALAGVQLWKMYTYGEGVEKDFEAANEWYRKVIERQPEGKEEPKHIQRLRKEHVDRTAPDFIASLEERIKEPDWLAYRELGTAYEEGIQVEMNPETAAIYYMKAAQLGDAESGYRIAEILTRYSPRQEDHETALDWYNFAAQAGVVEAMHHMGKAYFHGTGVPRNYPEALYLFRKAVKQGHLMSLRYLAVMYQDGLGVAANPEIANEIFLRMAALGDIPSQYLSGKYLIKQNDPQQWVQGMQNLERAALAQHPQAMLLYGEQRMRAMPRPRADAPDSAAYRWMLEAQRRDAPAALHTFGRLALLGYRPMSEARRLALMDRMLPSGEPVWGWYRGSWIWERGGVKERKPALRLIKASAASGVADAQYFLAHLYREGVEPLVPEDPESAFRWLKQAAENGHASACAELGYLLLGGGLNQPPDPVTAEQWIRRAVQQDSLQGKFLLGYLYQEGVAVERNLELAEQWLSEAAWRGHDAAQFQLGKLLETRAEIDADEAESLRELALMWYTKSAEQGFPDAQTAVQRMAGGPAEALDPEPEAP